VKTTLLPEPELEFGDGGTHIDVRFGIMRHGPLDRGTDLAPTELRVGIVGTQRCVEALLGWLERCRSEIPAKESRLANLFPRFPGFSPESCFAAELHWHDRWISEIHPQTIQDILETTPETATSEAVDLFLEHVRQVVETGGPMVVLCAPPNELLGVLDSSIGPRIDPVDAEIDEGGEGRSGSQHLPAFHDLLKARGMALKVPIQMIRSETYAPKLEPKKKRERKKGSASQRTVQDEATRAWNLHTALYYKGGGIPWRLVRRSSDLATCFVGISFYRTTDKQRVLTSMAQVFNERGEGIIIKGATAAISKDDRTPHLSEMDAHALLASAIKQFRTEHRTVPARVVVHKTSKMNKEELEGFSAATTDERIDTVDLVSVCRSEIRLFRHGTYPPLRGTLLDLDDRSALLYLRGSVNFFETYPGLYVPRAFEFTSHQGPSTIRTLADEIFALSKLNWNNTQFDGGEPITVRAARKVGDILKHVAEGWQVQNRFRFYM
jgi:hypothetical protein